jgi:hypothetical protein
MKHYQSIVADLYQIFPIEVDCPESFEECATPDEKFNAITAALEEAASLGDRKLLLANAFFLGKFLENELRPKALRTYYMQQVTAHYKTAAIRTYHIFKAHGVEQIM